MGLMVWMRTIYDRGRRGSRIMRDLVTRHG